MVRVLADVGLIGYGSVLADLRVLSLDLDFSTEPKREERRDLKLGVDLSFGSLGLWAR